MNMWGVRVGSSVYLVTDGPAAFREEARRRLNREDARAVFFGHNGWQDVPIDSVSRKDPAPPPGPRRLPWWDRLGRGGYWLGWLARRRGREAPPFGR